MPAATFDLAIEQGATFRQRIVMSLPDANDPTQAGAPVDLSACSARMQIRQRAGTAVLASLTSTNGDLELGSDGTITIHLSAQDTDTLTVRRASYDLEIIFPSGDVVRLVQGQVTISQNVTRDA